MAILPHSKDKSGSSRFSRGVVTLAAALIGATLPAISAPGTPILVSGDPKSEPASGKGLPPPSGQPSVQGQAGEDVLRQAEADFGSGRLEQALEKCMKAIDLNTRSAEAYYLLGVIHDRRGALQEAAQALRRSLELDPSSVEVHIYLGNVYLQSKQIDEAAAEFQSALKLGDDASAEGRFGLALALVSKSQYREALPYLTAAVEASPKNLQRLLSLTVAEVELDRLEDARGHLKRIESLSPESSQISYKLGILLLEHHMSNEAEAELGRAARLLEARAGSPPSDVSLATLYLNLAELRYTHRDYWEALRDFGKIPLASLSQKLRTEVLRFEAGALMAAGKPAEGLAKIKEAAQHDAPSAEDLIQQAWAEVLTGDLKAAKDSIRIAETKSLYSPELRRTAALIEREGLSPRPKVPLSQDWHLKGEGFVCCPCKVPCPCRSNAQPSEGHCETAAAFRIERGYYGKVRLDGFVFVALNGAMESLATPLTVFVERRATDEEIVALERIFQAFRPLQPFAFLSIERAPISFTRLPESQIYEVEVPRRVHLKIQRQLDGQARPLMQTAALDHFSNTIEYVQNLTDKVWDVGGDLQWDYSHRQANLRFIDLDAQDYQNGMMLGQFRDLSGFFNQKQLELIKALHLPMLSSYPGSDKQ